MKTSIPTKYIVYSAIACSLYLVLTLALAPISFGPLQLRVGVMLKPLVLIHPIFSVGFAIGTGLANLTSPFGPMDFIVMPFIDLFAGLLAWKLRRGGLATIVGHAAIMGIAVAYFPLYLGGQIPFFPTVYFVMASMILLEVIGYFTFYKGLAFYFENRHL